MKIVLALDIMDISIKLRKGVLTGELVESALLQLLAATSAELNWGIIEK
ncbi:MULTISPECIES: hypothetical protein [unclassified Paenibacillus]|nr:MULTISPECIES: hypothetical protein [unclassified Paenibacillus]EGL17615.1 hypothetical protein HMPREF9413_5630 [Paenibacillus sp. HGF7]